MGTPAEQQIRSFVDHDYSKVVRVVDALLNDVQRSEDVVCDALERAWTRLERGEVIENLAAWCTTVALNRARSQLRRKGVERRAHARLVLTESIAPPDIASDLALREALAALPKRQRELTALRYFGGMSVEEAAAILSMTAGAARSMLWTARKSLATALGEPLDDREPEVIA